MSAPEIKFDGLDVFVRQPELPQFASKTIAGFELTTISNRGTKVWPPPTPPIDMTDVYGCRFMARDAKPDFLSLLAALEKQGFEWVHTEKLLRIDGKPCYSVAQGE